MEAQRPLLQGASGLPRFHFGEPGTGELTIQFIFAEIGSTLFQTLACCRGSKGQNPALCSQRSGEPRLAFTSGELCDDLVFGAIASPLRVPFFFFFHIFLNREPGFSCIERATP